MPSVVFMIVIDCARLSPPRNSAFQAACMNAASRTSAMEKGVSKTASPFVVLAKAGTHSLRLSDAEGISHSWKQHAQIKPSAAMGPRFREDDTELPLERGLQAVELRHQRIADRGALR